MQNIKSIFRNLEVQKYFFNTSWLMGDKVISIGLLMLTSIIVARHLGPEGYGLLSYSVSLATLFAIATNMGLHGLAIRELVRFPDKHARMLGAIFWLKATGAIVALCAFFLLIFFTETIGDTPFFILLIVSGIILFKPFEVIDFWFQAKVMAKYPALSRVIAALFFATSSVLLASFGAGTTSFAFTYLLQAAALAVLLIFFYSRKSPVPLKSWTFRFSDATVLLGQSWMIMLGALFAMIYLKIDQVMIRWMVSVEEVGVYSVAVQLSESWYFIPAMLVASIFPKLIELRQSNALLFEKRLQQLFDLLFVISLILAAVITLFAGPLVKLLYGSGFEKAALFLTIHIWAAIFIFMRAAFSKWILIENVIAFSTLTQGLGALLNVVLNFVLIPHYGGTGAAIATLISYATASYFSLIFFSKTRPVFKMMTLALLSPFRYIYVMFRPTTQDSSP